VDKRFSPGSGVGSVVPGTFEEQARNIQKLMGPSDIQITAIDNHAHNRCPYGIAHPQNSL
jgi:hypothetical protein